MAGAASNQLRSAFVAEVTAGTIPTSPGFTTLHSPLLMTATPEMIETRSLVGKGARKGHGVAGIPVAGSLEGPLVYGVYDTLIATMLQGAWSTDVLKDGKSAPTVTVENAIPAGIGGTNTMLRYRGVEATGGSLTLTGGQAARLSLTVAGRGSDAPATSALSGATYTDPTEFDPLSSGVDVGTVTMAGYTLDCIQSATINFTYEGREAQPRIGSNDLCGMTRGVLVPVIEAMFYLETNFAAIVSAARARHSAFAVSFPVGSVTGEKYTVDFPACRFSAATPDFSGPNAFNRVTILPEYDATEACVCKITRAVA